jgi:hypothetical protein
MPDVGRVASRVQKRVQNTVGRVLADSVTP